MKFVTLLILLLSSASQAASFKGFKRMPSQESLVFTEQVLRVIEREDAFLILFSHRPAFYRFPKNIDYASQVKVYLNNRIKDKKPIRIEWNPQTAEIFSIGDTQ